MTKMLKFERARYWFSANVELGVWQLPPGRCVEVHADVDQAPSSAACAMLHHWLAERQLDAQEAILACLFDKLRQQPDDFCDVDDEGLSDKVAAPSQLLPFLTLRSITVHGLDADGRPLLGYTFDCTWDDEHGVGAMLKGTEVVEVGGADTAILAWVAEGHTDSKALRPLP